MNKVWLARAQLFELPGKLCKRGHDLAKEGTYQRTIKHQNGKTYPTDSCRRCRIEDAVVCRAKKRLAEARSRSFGRAA